MNIELLKIGMESHKSLDYVNSIRYFTQAISEDPTDFMTFQLYLAIGEGKFKLKDYEGSIVAYDNGLNFYYENIVHFKQQHPQIIESTQVILEQAYRIRGNAKNELGDYKGAIQDFSKSIELNNKLSTSIYSRGVVYMDTKNFSAAKNDFLRVLELNPNDALAYRNLGNAKFQLNDFSGAVNDYTKAIELSIPFEHRGEVYNNMGSAKASLGHYKDAIKDFEKSLAINPNDPVALENRKILLTHLNS
ncbi:MAG: tetratricopeptide repeat protein [Chitinophagaceae bacterium]|nr:tetratricopeptide repeat protein [Chitinophagaceae bacterium]